MTKDKRTLKEKELVCLLGIHEYILIKKYKDTVTVVEVNITKIAKIMGKSIRKCKHCDKKEY